MSTAGVDALSRAELEERLLEALTKDRYLVVIDGLERLMAGYAQTAERPIDNEGTRAAPDREGSTVADRRMNDRRDGAFVARLAAPLASRLLITTRLMPAEFEGGGGGELRSSVSRIDLPGLGIGDAIELWRGLLPEPTIDPEIVDIIKACDFHPLAISILARSAAAAVDGARGAGPIRTGTSLRPVHRRRYVRT